MHEIKHIDWKSLTFNVMSLEESDIVIEKFPELARYPDIQKMYKDFPDADKMMRYIILFYDIGSQLRNIFPDIGRRKYEAAILADIYLTKSGKFATVVEQAIYGFNRIVNKAIISYLRIIKNPTYAQLAIFQDSYYIELEKLKDPDEKTKDVIANVKTLRDEIESLTKLFLSGDNSQQLICDIYESIEEENLLLRPEDVAKKLAELKRKQA